MISPLCTKTIFLFYSESLWSKWKYPSTYNPKKMLKCKRIFEKSLLLKMISLLCTKFKNSSCSDSQIEIWNTPLLIYREKWVLDMIFLDCLQKVYIWRFVFPFFRIWIFVSLPNAFYFLLRIWLLNFGADWFFLFSFHAILLLFF